MSTFSDKATPYVAGAGAYYGLNSIFIFYPAFILGIFFTRLICGDPIPESEMYLSSNKELAANAFMLNIFLFFVFMAIFYGLMFFKQWFLVIFFYIITLWPFLYILGHIGDFPIPLDWCPLW